MSQTPDYDEVELVALADGSTVIIDLAEWLPQVHHVWRRPGLGDTVTEDALSALGMACGRQRDLLIREMSHMRVAASIAHCNSGLPESAVVYCDLVPPAMANNMVASLARAGVRCTGFIVRSDSMLETHALVSLVRAFYSAGVYRARLVLSDSDVESAEFCAALFMLTGE